MEYAPLACDRGSWQVQGGRCKPEVDGCPSLGTPPHTRHGRTTARRVQVPLRQASCSTVTLPLTLTLALTLTLGLILGLGLTEGWGCLAQYCCWLGWPPDWPVVCLTC